MDIVRESINKEVPLLVGKTYCDKNTDVVYILILIETEGRSMYAFIPAESGYTKAVWNKERAQEFVNEMVLVTSELVVKS